MKYLFSVRPIITGIFLFSLIYVLSYDFYLKDYLDKRNDSVVIFDVLERISFSLIATVVFYFINQHVPQEKNREKTLSQLKRSVNLLQIDLIHLLSSLGIESNFDSFPDQALLDEKFTGRVTTEVIQGLGFTTLKYPINEFVTLAMERMNEELRNVLIFHDTIDNEVLIKLLAIKRNVDERRQAFFFGHIDLPLTWESPNLAYLGKTLTEINSQLSSKSE